MKLRFTKANIALLLTGSFLFGAAAGLVSRFSRRETRRTPTAAPSANYRAHVPFKVAEPILDGRLAAGWQDWGWGKHELDAAGSPRLVFGGFGGITFKHAEVSRHFGALSFRYLAPASFGEFLEVALKYEQTGEDVLPRVRVDRSYLADVGGRWKEALIPWSKLNPANSRVDRVVIRAHKAVGQDWVLLDKVVLTEPEASGLASAPVRAIDLAVDCGRPGARINPLIYGVAHAASDDGATARRIGGNPMTRLNWELGAWNTGNDWFFQNQPGDGPEGLFKWLDESERNGTKMSLVVPTIGWVAKDSTSVGFPVSKFGKQRAHDPSRPEAGDGFDPAGKPLRPGPPTQTSVAAPPEVIRRFMRKLRERDQARGVRSVDIYILDNETGLWHTTHRDVHPDPMTYDELWDRTLRYASVVREVDPEGLIAGPSAWGWPEYFMSAKDLEAGWIVHPDRRAHGDVPLLAWYLQKLADHEKKTGQRLLDLVNVHFYPQAGGVYGDGAKIDAETSALRLRTTRALWDLGYRDESWINEPIRLIPRLKDWVSENYPGRGIMIGEWSFGAEHHASGGLAIAEALGRFGQQGVAAAFYWQKLAKGTPGYWAFRAFRNYDGNGAAFLDFSVPTRESNDVSLFASRDEATQRLVLVLVNRDPAFAAGATIDVSSCGAGTKKRGFVFGGIGPGLDADTSKPAEDEGIQQVIPPYGIAVVEIELAKR
jgi:hypothetical protein